MNQENNKTFRCEKSTWNIVVSSTREFWNLRFKTKSWNFFEVRWRPYSPKESFLDNFVFNLKLTDLFCAFFVENMQHVNFLAFRGYNEVIKKKKEVPAW